VSEKLTRYPEFSGGERPSAALLLSEERLARANLLQMSATFRDTYSDILPKGCGVVVQIVPDETAGAPESGVTTTLIFDARGYRLDRYIWELTHGQGGARKIWQIEATSSFVAGSYYETSQQGQQITESSIEGDALEEILEEINTLILSPELAENVRERRARRDKATERLRQFVQENQTIARQSKHGFKKFFKEYERREDFIQSTGFTPLTPYKPTRQILD
jgi:hypothetical protein